MLLGKGQNNHPVMKLYDQTSSGLVLCMFLQFYKQALNRSKHVDTY